MEPRPVEETLCISLAEEIDRRADQLRDPARSRGREARLEEPTHPMPDEIDDLSLGEFRKAEAAQRLVHRRGQIGTRVDERAVEIEDEVAVAGRGVQTANDEPHPQVRSALGFTNLKPAACSPST